MYGIEFYETEDGKCPIWDFLEALRLKAPTNKDARIQHKQASLYIELLQQNGTHMNAEITKHLDDGIWELRPGNNRVFYFFYQNDTYSSHKFSYLTIDAVYFSRSYYAPNQTFLQFPATFYPQIFVPIITAAPTRYTYCTSFFEFIPLLHPHIFIANVASIPLWIKTNLRRITQWQSTVGSIRSP